MPRNIERDKREADRRKNQLIEAGFRLFSQNGIETVSLQKVADAANVSPATMYKYFLTKEKLLIAISAKVWDEVWQEALGDPGTNHFEHFTAYQGIEFYADRMIALYKNRPEVLRFSGEYKTYMNRRGNMEDKQLREHLDVLKPMQLLFHGMYERAKVDGSIRTDIPEEEMFITSSITICSVYRAVRLRQKHPPQTAHVPVSAGFRPAVPFHEKREPTADPSMEKSVCLCAAGEPAFVRFHPQHCCIWG